MYHLCYKIVSFWKSYLMAMNKIKCVRVVEFQTSVFYPIYF